MFTFYLSVLEFLKSVLELNFELAFLSISNLIFTASVACKNQVANRQKIKFKNQLREIEILRNQVQIDRGSICGQGSYNPLDKDLCQA